MKKIWSPSKQFRYIIVAIVIAIVGLAFMDDAPAQLTVDQTPNSIITPDIIVPVSADTVAPMAPPILYNIPKDARTNLYTEKSHPDEYCIALNIYFEARAENLAGKYAVADVVLNRVNDSRFPNTVCEVIREGPTYESWETKKHPELPDEERIYLPVRDRCQFSWYCDGETDIPDQRTAWRDAQIIAYNIVQFGTFRGITEGATHYHATYVNPEWSLEAWRPVYHLIGRIGDHIFYKWI